ncbi:MAG: hypothetical protein U0235_30885 [Polyangiaceae bacterium]
MIALVPLAPIAALGMEHAAHIAAVVALVAEATRAPAPRSRRLAFLSALVVGLRYEGVFVVALVALLLTRRRELRGAAIALASGAVLPLAAAAFFIHHGAPFAPASVLMKRTEVPLGALPSTILDRLRANPHVAAPSSAQRSSSAPCRATPRLGGGRGGLRRPRAPDGVRADRLALPLRGLRRRGHPGRSGHVMGHPPPSLAPRRDRPRPRLRAAGALAHATVLRAARNIADQQMQLHISLLPGASRARQSRSTTSARPRSSVRAGSSI